MIGSHIHYCSKLLTTAIRYNERLIKLRFYIVLITELSMGWVDPWVGLGRDFSVFGGLGWVHYSKSTNNLILGDIMTLLFNM